jgi:hypothetical protein
MPAADDSMDASDVATTNSDFLVDEIPGAPTIPWMTIMLVLLSFSVSFDQRMTMLHCPLHVAQLESNHGIPGIIV